MVNFLVNCIKYVHFVLLTCRDASNTKMPNHGSNESNQLPPLSQLCRNAFHTVLSSPSNPSIINDISDDHGINRSSTNNTSLSLFDSPNTAQINGNVRLNIEHAQRDYNIDETIIDKEELKRRMSVISTNIEYTFKGIRKTLNTLNEQNDVKEEQQKTNQNFEGMAEVDQYCNSSSEENTTEEENHSEIVDAFPDFTR